MTRPRLVATDLDGTLIREDHSISPRTADALIRTRQAGIAVVAVTARPPRVFGELTALPGLLDAAVCANGALVYDPAGERILKSRTITVPVARKVVAELTVAIPGITFAVETGFEVVAESAYTRVDRVADRRVILPTMDDVWEQAGQIAKLLAYSATEHVDDLLNAARKTDLAGVEVSHSGGRGLLEISAAGVTKAGTLADYCAGQGISAADVIAFGDMPNDAPMLRWAGTSYSVAGAHPEASRAATAHTAGNEDDGVAIVLEQLLDAG